MKDSAMHLHKEKEESAYNLLFVLIPAIVFAVLILFIYTSVAKPLTSYQTTAPSPTAVPQNTMYESEEMILEDATPTPASEDMSEDEMLRLESQVEEPSL